MNHTELLIKYIAHVTLTEGCSFIDSLETAGNTGLLSGVTFTIDEYNELTDLEDLALEVYNS